MNTTLSKHDISQETLREYFAYDPATGHLTWIKKAGKRVNLTHRAGSLIPKSGYRSINFKGRSFPEHHLIWCWYYGFWPKSQLDHINHVRSDNRIENLREVTVAENAQNRRRRENTRVGEAGIWFNKRTGKYVAEISMNCKRVFRKSFTDIDEAVSARKAKLIELGFHINHGA